MDQAAFEERIGRTVEVFPKDLYSSANIRKYLESGSQPITIIWDPYGLLDDLTAVRQIDQAMQAMKQALTAREPVEHDWPAPASRLLQLLQLAGTRLARDTRGYELGYKNLIDEEPPTGPLRKQYPVLSEEDWELLDRYRRNPEYADRPWPADRDDLMAIRALLEDETVSKPHASITPETLDALSRAEKLITWWLRLTDNTFRVDDHPRYEPSGVLGVLGDADRTYLETVDWRPLRTGDETRYERLVNGRRGIPRLGDQPPGPELTGYDPFGRLVIRVRSGEAYLVEWPLVVPSERYPDEARIVACDDEQRTHATGARPVYVRLPDGTMDLLPADPMNIANAPPFKWGYAGGGPGWLEAAIRRNCCQDYRNRDPATDEEFPTFRWWLSDQIESAPDDRLDLQVGEVRRWFSGNVTQEEYKAWWSHRHDP
jgi:hypothetical protein